MVGRMITGLRVAWDSSGELRRRRGVLWEPGSDSKGYAASTFNISPIPRIRITRFRL